MTSKIQKLAERAMGWELVTFSHHQPLKATEYSFEGDDAWRQKDCYKEPWNPLESDADALELLEACAKHVGSIEQVYIQWNDGGWNAGVVGASYYVAGDNIPDVIVKLACQIFDVK